MSFSFCAGAGNRTRTQSLARTSSTIKLRPHVESIIHKKIKNQNFDLSIILAYYVKICARGETDITTVFGTVVAGSIPAERTKIIYFLE